MSKRARKSTQKMIKEIASEIDNGAMPFKKTRSSYAVLEDAVMQHVDRLQPSQLMHLKRLIKKKYHKGVDINYLKAIMFPEYFSSDVPQPLTNLAYCRFTDKQDLIVSTGPKGAGMLLWFPRTTQGPSLFYLADGDTNQDATQIAVSLPTGLGIQFQNLQVLSPGQGSGSVTTTQPCFDNGVWYYGMWKNYSDCFTQTSLVAASISIQYIGPAEAEAGMYVGGHIYGLSPANLVIEDIEQSQYATKRRPGDGLRFTHLPMETSDYEYYATSKNSSQNGGAAQVGNDRRVFFRTDTAANSKLPRNVSDVTKSAATKTSVIPSTQNYATGEGILYSSSSNYVAIYWKGLGAVQDWIRIDSVRKFNGVPKQQYRDVVEVARCKKNYDSKKTFDVLKQLCINTPVGGHSLRDVESQMDRIVTNLPNASSLLLQGEQLQSQSLEDLANALEREM